MDIYNLLITPAGKTRFRSLSAALALGFGMLSITSCIAQEGPAAVSTPAVATPAVTTTVGNPFVRDMYTADPSAHVWKDGRLYVYPHMILLRHVVAT
jgi:arabinoxylan arabinofuranohydrolase